MELDALLTNINAVTLLSVFAGGSTLGLYFAFLNKFKKSENLTAGLVSFVVIGWSFYLPFMFASMVTTPEASPLRFLGSMFLWVVFTLATTVSYQAASLANQFKHRND